MKHINTILAHAAVLPDSKTAALIPPLHLATTFERETDGTYPQGYKYTREANPTRHLLENTLCELESGFGCRSFASGLAASQAIIQALEPGAHIIIPDDVYHGFRQLVCEIHEGKGLTVSSVDMRDVETIQGAVQGNTRMIWVETPSNPLLQITDIQAVAEIAHRAEARLVVDGTWTTPVLQRPFDWGADIVVHSLTKYMAGHSDVLGGAVVSRENSDLFQTISLIQQQAGAVLDPFSCWLTLRGLRTLAVRLQVQCDAAEKVAVFLQSHTRVSAVHFPGLPEHPGHEAARKQMKRFGGMLSVEIAGSEKEAIKVAASVRLFRRATSLGGTESLIEHRATMEGPDTRTPRELLRLSFGLEHVDDLIQDLEQALGKI